MAPWSEGLDSPYRSALHRACGGDAGPGRHPGCPHHATPLPEGSVSAAASGSAPAGPGGPGQLLSSKPFDGVHLSNAKAWRILYRSTTGSGAAVTASAVVVVPTDASGSRPMLLWGSRDDGGVAAGGLSVLALPVRPRPGVGRRGASRWRRRRPRLHRHGCRRADDVPRRGRRGARLPRRGPSRPPVAGQRPRRRHHRAPDGGVGAFAGWPRRALDRDCGAHLRTGSGRRRRGRGVTGDRPAGAGRHDQVEHGRRRSADVLRAHQLRGLLPRRQA